MAALVDLLFSLVFAILLPFPLIGLLLLAIRPTIFEHIRLTAGRSKKELFVRLSAASMVCFCFCFLFAMEFRKIDEQHADQAAAASDGKTAGIEQARTETTATSPAVNNPDLQTLIRMHKNFQQIYADVQRNLQQIKRNPNQAEQGNDALLYSDRLSSEAAAHFFILLYHFQSKDLQSLWGGIAPEGSVDDSFGKFYWGAYGTLRLIYRKDSGEALSAEDLAFETQHADEMISGYADYLALILKMYAILGYQKDQVDLVNGGLK